MRVAKVQARAVKPLARLPAARPRGAQHFAVRPQWPRDPAHTASWQQAHASSPPAPLPLTFLLVDVEVQRREAPRHHQHCSSDQRLPERQEAPGEAPLQWVPAKPAHAVVPARHVAAGQKHLGGGGGGIWCQARARARAQGQGGAVLCPPGSRLNAKRAKGACSCRPSQTLTGRGAAASLSTGFRRASTFDPVMAASWGGGCERAAPLLLLQAGAEGTCLAARPGSSACLSRWSAQRPSSILLAIAPRRGRCSTTRARTVRCGTLGMHGAGRPVSRR